jgi:hypothetical protein
LVAVSVGAPIGAQVEVAGEDHMALRRDSSSLFLIIAFLGLAPVVARAQQVYDGPDWVKFGCTTYPLDLNTTPQGGNAFSRVTYGNSVPGDTTRSIIYNPADA